jgi:hypothetical protein
MPLAERVASIVRSAQSANHFFGLVWKKPPAVFEPFDVLHVLLQHRVEFVVIDGLAAAVWGSPVITIDTAICCPNSPDDRAALESALQELGVAHAELPESETWRVAFETRKGKVECTAVAAYADLRSRASDLELAPGVHVRVASLDDVIALKQAANTIKDRIELETLAAVKEEREKLL